MPARTPFGSGQTYRNADLAHVVRRVAARVEVDRERRSRGAFVFTLEPVAIRSG